MHTSIKVLAAATALAMMATSSFAQKAPIKGVPPPPTSTGNNPACVTLCGNLTFVPPNRRVPRKLVIDKDKGCVVNLPRLANVTAREIRSIGRHDKVRLLPICDRLLKTLTAQQTNIAGRGNASGLIKVMAANPAIWSSLRRAHYAPDDVLSVHMGNNFVNLYVHKQ